MVTEIGAPRLARSDRSPKTCDHELLSCTENITEDAHWPPNSNLYSTTKQQAEKAVWKVADKMPVAVARPGHVVGPQQYACTVLFVEKIKQGTLVPPTDAIPLRKFRIVRGNGHALLAS